jgi:hypothetical protein
MGTKAAVEQMRAALLRFVDYHGVPREKYNEEVTVFWIELIAEKLAEMGPEASVVEKCNYVIKNTDGTDFNQTTHTPASQAVIEESPARS